MKTHGVESAGITGSPCALRRHSVVDALRQTGLAVAAATRLTTQELKDDKSGKIARLVWLNQLTRTVGFYKPQSLS